MSPLGPGYRRPEPASPRTSTLSAAASVASRTLPDGVLGVNGERVRMNTNATQSTEVDEVQPESPEQLRERMRELGRRGAEARWRKAAERKAAAESGENAEGHAPGEGRGEALKALYAVLGAKDAPHAAVVAAARALLDAEAGASTIVPTTVQTIQSLPTADLHRLVGRLEPAHSIPEST